MKKMKKKVFLVVLLVLMSIFIFAACNNNDTGGNGDDTEIPNKIIESIEITTMPTINFVAGEDVTISGGKITVKYDDSYYADEVVDITDQMVELLVDGTIKVTYGDKTKVKALSDTIVKVSTTEEFITALSETEEEVAVAVKNKEVKTIFVAEGDYELTAGFPTTNIRRDIVIIGFGEVNIAVTGTTSSQGAFIFQRNTTLKNINFEIKTPVTGNERTHIKFTNIQNPIIKKIEKVFLESVKVTGEDGMNIHGAKSATLKNCEITPTNLTLKGVALAITSVENGQIINSKIGQGPWGSIGIMYKVDPEDPAAYDLSSHLTVDAQSTVSSFIYADHYEKYGYDAENVITINMPGWVSNGNGRYGTVDMFNDALSFSGSVGGWEATSSNTYYFDGVSLKTIRVEFKHLQSIEYTITLKDGTSVKMVLTDLAKYEQECSQYFDDNFWIATYFCNANHSGDSDCHSHSEGWSYGVNTLSATNLPTKIVAKVVLKNGLSLTTSVTINND